MKFLFVLGIALTVQMVVFGVLAGLTFVFLDALQTDSSEIYYNLTGACAATAVVGGFGLAICIIGYDGQKKK